MITIQEGQYLDFSIFVSVKPVLLLIFAIRQLKVKSGQELNKPSVIVMAPTANAAFIIQGKTIESALGIYPNSKKNFLKATGDKASEMKFLYEDVVVIICDEISMVGSTKLTKINFRLQELAHSSKKHMFMGGKSFIASGDLQQLPPIHDSLITKNSPCDQRPSCSPSHWNENFKIYYLDQKMRCQKDPEFAGLCDRVGKGSMHLTVDDENYLRERICDTPSENKNENFTSGKIAIIVTTNKKREEINLEKLGKLLPDEPHYVCLSTDKVTNMPDFHPLPKNIAYSKTGGQIKELIIKQSAPVVMTSNHKVKKFKEDGLMNGARGYIDYIQVSQTNPSLVEIIWVVFSKEEIGKRYRAEHYYLRKELDFLHPRSTPILPVKKPFEVDQGNITYVRTQFPLTLAYALTAHKCQGETLDEVIVDFTPSSDGKKAFIDNGSFYVAITRVKEGSKLFLKGFDMSYIKVHPQVQYEIETMRQFKQYKMKKIYLYENVFKGEDKLKIGYLNINDLKHSYHAEYINGDHNLLNLDILALAHTGLQKDDNINDILNNWSVIVRIDSPDGRPHMGIVILTPKLKPLNKFYIEKDFYKMRNEQVQIQGLILSVHPSIDICFIYCRETPTLSESMYILERTCQSNYIMGDLNLNPNIASEEKQLKCICSQTKVKLLSEITTKLNVQLDHILGEKNKDCKIYTTTYLNFVSDHRTIVLRISEEGDNFVTDHRLKIGQPIANLSEALKDVKLKYTTDSDHDSSFNDCVMTPNDTPRRATKRKAKPPVPSFSDSDESPIKQRLRRKK